MNELAEFSYNLQAQTPKILHEQQNGIYGFHSSSPHSTRVHTAISTLMHGRKHTHTNTITHICTPPTHARAHTDTLLWLLLPFAWLLQLGNELIHHGRKCIYLAGKLL